MITKKHAPFSLILKDLISRFSLNNREAEYHINFSVSLRSEASSKIIKQVSISHFEFKIETILPSGNCPESHVTIDLISENDYLVRWQNVIPRMGGPDTERSNGETRAKVQFNNLLPIAFEFSENQNEKSFMDLPRVFVRLNDIIRNIMTLYTYIGPLREEPSRRYIYENEVFDIGIKGENAAYIYTTEQDKIIKGHYFCTSNEGIFTNIEEIKLAKAVSLWLELMDIKGFCPESQNEIIRLTMDSSVSDRTRVNIADVGFGVSQIFPIVLEGLRMPVRSTLLLEQPEIHLHPKLQMQMADYFISLALSGKGVIVETHSDHIVNLLVRRIVEDEKYGLKDLIGIYFITPNSSMNWAGWPCKN